MHIVKRRGHKESYDEKKVYASVYAAALSANLDKEKAEGLAEVICKEISTWMKGKEEVNSTQIFEKVTNFLKKHDEPTALMYSTHRDLS